MKVKVYSTPTCMYCVMVKKFLKENNIDFEDINIAEDIEAARQVVFAYWEAFNSYDLEGVLAFLEESWREERTESIASEISQMEMADMTMGVEEEAEPEVTDGTIAIKMFIDIPVIFMPDRHYIYYLKNIEGEWKIYLAEEVEE